jgi:hypothetical protein
MTQPMGYYLIDHPPASTQFRNPRRERLSGVVVVHTAENAMDIVGVDTGAENVASFISRRADPGSYHELVDSDSVVAMMPDSYESFQVAVDGHNRHAWGISLACRSTDLHPDLAWTRAVITAAGARIAAFWQRNWIDVASAARWLSRDEALARNTPGLITHGALQPADRSDAWTRHSHREVLDRMLVDAVLAFAKPAQPYGRPMMLDVTTLPDGRAMEFRAFWGTVVHRWQEVPNGRWTGWRNLDPHSGPPEGLVDSVQSFINKDGRAEIVAWNSNTGRAWRKFQTVAGGGWTVWIEA